MSEVEVVITLIMVFFPNGSWRLGLGCAESRAAEKGSERGKKGSFFQGLNPKVSEPPGRVPRAALLGAAAREEAGSRRGHRLGTAGAPKVWTAGPAAPAAPNGSAPLPRSAVPRSRGKCGQRGVTARPPQKGTSWGPTGGRCPREGGRLPGGAAGAALAVLPRSPV